MTPSDEAKEFFKEIHAQLGGTISATCNAFGVPLWAGYGIIHESAAVPFELKPVTWRRILTVKANRKKADKESMDAALVESLGYKAGRRHEPPRQRERMHRL